jgi:hypothetical protein
MIMLTDASKAVNSEMQVLDIAELVAKNIGVIEENKSPGYM